MLGFRYTVLFWGGWFYKTLVFSPWVMKLVLNFVTLSLINTHHIIKRKKI